MARPRLNAGPTKSKALKSPGQILLKASILESDPKMIFYFVGSLKSEPVPALASNLVAKI